jgi:uncharacterized protein YfaS (alpha-2-macroglobulin family)
LFYGFYAHNSPQLKAVFMSLKTLPIKMKRKIIIITLLALAITGITLAIVDVNPKYTERDMITLIKGDSNLTTWGKIDSLEKQGLYITSLELVDSLFQEAIEENNTNQVIKTTLYKLKYNQRIQEDDYIYTIDELSNLLDTIQNPERQIVHSIIAEVYWSYYLQNRWKFQNRTETENFEQKDLRTWDLNKLLQTVSFHYQASLKDASYLQKINISSFENILLYYSNSNFLRPTVYDFLGHRALKFFNSTESELTKAKDAFVMNDEAYYAQTSRFIDIEINSNDLMSSKALAIQIYQSLMKYHLSQNNTSALISLNLERLNFVRNNCTISKSDSLFYDALERFSNVYVADSLNALVFYQMAKYLVGQASQYTPLLSDEYKNKNKEAYKICNSTIETYPSSRGAILCENLENQIAYGSISGSTEKVNIPNRPIQFNIQSKNLNSINVGLIKMDFNDYRKDTENKGTDDLYNYLRRKEMMKQWEQKLYNDDDFNIHTQTINLEGLEPGFYILLMGTDGNFKYEKSLVSYQVFWVSNLSVTSRQNMDQSVEWLIRDRLNGRPIEGANVQVFKSEYNYTTRKYVRRKLTNLKTDKDGFAKLGASSDYRDLYVDINYGKDSYSSYDSYYQNANQNYPFQSYDQTSFFLDRGIYRPGQKIYFKGLVLHYSAPKEMNIKTNHKTTVYLYDHNYQKVAETKVSTNDYGTFQGVFNAPTGVINGQMYLSTSNTQGQKYFNVEEYKRPKFEAKFDPIEGSFKLKDKVTVKGNAKMYGGSNVDGATVKYSVTRSARFPWWCFYYWRYQPTSPSVQLEFGETTTDSKGEFSVEFEALPDAAVDPKYSPYFSYTIQADITDINGETRSTSTYVTIGYKSMELSLSIPETVIKQNLNKIIINSTNLSGEKLNAKGEIKVYQLTPPNRIIRNRLLSEPDIKQDKSEFLKLYPYDLYARETNKMKWKRKLSKSFDFDTKVSDSLNPSFIKQLSPGHYLIHTESKDIEGNKVEEYKTVLILDKLAEVDVTNDYFFAHQIENTVEPENNAEILVSSGADNAKILYEIEWEEKIVKRQWINLKKNQKLISIPIEEKHRGGLVVHFTMVNNSRSYQKKSIVVVPFTNKELDISFETFRNKLLPGQKEKWKLKIKDKTGDKLMAEMLATMYDASLDAFAANSFYLNLYQSYYSRLNWDQHNTFGIQNSNLYYKDYYPTPKNKQPLYHNRLNWFGYYTYTGYYSYGWSGLEGGEMAGRSFNNRLAAQSKSKATATPMGETIVGNYKVADASAPTTRGDFDAMDIAEEANQPETGASVGKKMDKAKHNDWSVNEQKIDLGNIKARSNFSETAFFYPQLMTDSEGAIIVSFEVPESLTKWKFMGLAHTKDLKVGTIQEEIITQKDLMVFPNTPRFLRQGDQISISTKISNISEKDLKGKCQLFLFNPYTGEAIDADFANSNASQSIAIKGKESTALSWTIKVPDNYSAVKYKIVAQAGKFTDGEENAIPILTNRMLVTESMPLPIRSNETKNFKFDKLLNYKSKTLKHHKLTLEFTANPAWYAIQAMPYMIEYPYECTEQTFTRYYANSLASEIMNSNPKIKTIVEAWGKRSPDSFLSNLEKNQELKSVILEETPWVLQAKDESERKKRIAVLFDLNRMSNEMDRAFKKIEEAQTPNGGWTWFPGMPDSRYISTHIVTGFGHLDKLGIKSVRQNYKTWNMIQRGVKYLDARAIEDLREIKKYDKDYRNNKHLSYLQIQYLYARSFFNDIPLSNNAKEAHDHFMNQSEKYWLDFNNYAQGMIALAQFRKNTPKTDLHVEATICESLKQRAINHEELGMYWKGMMDGGYYWYQAPIETQALMIEMFNEITQDMETVENLKVWLLKQKQVNDWKTTKATANACYALFMNGVELLDDNQKVDITIGDQQITYTKSNDPQKIYVKTEPGTNYFKTTWDADEIKKAHGNVKITKNTEGVAWGALYWQYFEDLDKITTHETPLKLKKNLFKEITTKNGIKLVPITDKEINIGDKIIVRIELQVDRNMEYVHMKDMRASGFEPINVISRYKWQDGLGYYESTKDASTNFFFDQVGRGTYVFEYPLRASHAGNFSNGITSIQCMYAPEFTSHSEGIRIDIKK